MSLYQVGKTHNHSPGPFLHVALIYSPRHIPTNPFKQVEQSHAAVPKSPGRL